MKVKLHTLFLSFLIILMDKIYSNNNSNKVLGDHAFCLSVINNRKVTGKRIENPLFLGTCTNCEML